MHDLSQPLLPAHRKQIKDRADMLGKTKLVLKNTNKDGSGKKQVPNPEHKFEEH